jgi:hypothetical protein
MNRPILTAVDYTVTFGAGVICLFVAVDANTLLSRYFNRKLAQQSACI